MQVAVMTCKARRWEFNVNNGVHVFQFCLPVKRMYHVLW